jgi:hypothetical protein
VYIGRLALSFWRTSHRRVLEVLDQANGEFFCLLGSIVESRASASINVCCCCLEIDLLLRL